MAAASSGEDENDVEAAEHRSKSVKVPRCQTAFVPDESVPLLGKYRDTEEPRNNVAPKDTSTVINFFKKLSWHSKDDAPRAAGRMSDMRAHPSMSHKLGRVREAFDIAPNTGKINYYDHDKMMSWESLYVLSCSALCQRPVWHMIVFIIATTTVTAALTMLIPNARKISTDRFQIFFNFLKVFLSFMIGIHVSQSFKRWWTCVKEFKGYLVSIKQMMFLLRCVNLDKDMISKVQKLAIASCYVFNEEVITFQQIATSRKAWMEKTLDWLTEQNLLEEEENLKLLKVLDWKYEARAFDSMPITGTLWSWIGHMLSRARIEHLKTIPPPLQIRLLSAWQDVTERIEEVKGVVSAQVPFMYAQLLTFLIYVNNTLLGLTSGIAIGSALCEIKDRSKQLEADKAGQTLRPSDSLFTPKQRSELIGEYYQAFQTAGVQLAIALFQPMLYVAFLHIADMLSYPFGDQAYHLPTESFVAKLHVDLNVLSEGRSWCDKYVIGIQAEDAPDWRKDEYKSDDDEDDGD